MKQDPKGLGRSHAPKNPNKGFKRGDENEGKATQFKPGVSGNPSGGPKNPFPALIREATENGGEIVRRVLKIMRETQSDKTRMWAIEWLRDTGWCKPVQGVRGSDEDGNDAPLRIVFEK